MKILDKQDCRVIHSALSDYYWQLRANGEIDSELLEQRIQKLKELFFKQF